MKNVFKEMIRNLPMPEPAPGTARIVIAGRAGTPLRKFEDLEPEERKRIEEAIPVFQNSIPTPDGKKVAEEKLRNMLNMFADDVAATFRPKLKEFRRINETNVATFEKMQGELDALRVALQEANAATKAAQEGRGQYENTKLTEIVADRDAKVRDLAKAAEDVARLTVEVGKLKNELTGRAAALTGYEREKAELMGAAVITADKMQTASAQLTEAQHNIEDRYGAKVPPFWDTILANIKTALAQLPQK